MSMMHVLAVAVLVQLVFAILGMQASSVQAALERFCGCPVHGCWLLPPSPDPLRFTPWRCSPLLLLLPHPAVQLFMGEEHYCTLDTCCSDPTNPTTCQVGGRGGRGLDLGGAWGLVGLLARPAGGHAAAVPAALLQHLQDVRYQEQCTGSGPDGTPCIWANTYYNFDK